MAGAKVFISYKRNEELSVRLCREVEAQLGTTGYEPLVDHHMEGGDRWPEQLYRWLLECAGAVVIITPSALGSDWCQREWHVLAARAHAAGVRVVPVFVGVDPQDVKVFKHLQGLFAADDGVPTPEIIRSLGSLKPWSVTPLDFLALHAAWNRHEFESAAVFGHEKFSLKEVYQESDCGVLTWGEVSGKVDPFNEENGGRHPIVDTVMRLVEDPRFDETIVLQGPAGAGKSTFTLRLTEALENKGLQAIRIRFRDMRLSTYDSVPELLADALRVGPESEVAPEVSADLFDTARLRDVVEVGSTALCRWVFILDGWDEVSLAGSASYKTQLRTWLPRIREYLQRPGPPVRLIITGRPSVELKESGFLRKNTALLTVRSLRPEQVQAMANVFVRKADWGLTQERCNPVFQMYEKWFADKNSSGVEMLGLPLLSLLTFRTLSAWQGPVEDLLSAPSALYCALIDETVSHSGKGRAELSKKTIHRGGADLRRLLMRTAAMVSIFSTERISFDELAARLEEDQDLARWVDTATQENPLHELVVNFYFKGGHSELGCEFLHKSFREYLFAEAILQDIKDLAPEEKGALEPTHLPYWKDFDAGSIWHEASRRLARLLSPSWLAPEVRTHLFWLLSREIQKNPQRWVFLRDLLTDVYGWWAEGVHLRAQPEKKFGRRQWKDACVNELAKWALPYTNEEAEPVRIVTLDGHLGYAMIQIVAHIHYALHSIDSGRECRPRRYQKVTDDGLVRFNPGEGYLRQIFSRWEPVYMPFHEQLFLPGVFVEGENLSGLDLDRVNFCASYLRSVNIDRAKLSVADFSEANLEGVSFDSANLSFSFWYASRVKDSDFGRVHCKFLSFIRAELIRCNFEQIECVNGKFLGARLLDCNFRAAGLVGVDFSGSELKGVDFSRADMREADFSGSKLENCTSVGAKKRKDKIAKVR